MSAGRSRERLSIGEAAGLLGVTPKAIRHYEKPDLIVRPERSEVGYRLYAADDLLRLHRTEVLRSFGLSLGQIKGLLGEGDFGADFGKVLQTLLGEVEGQIEHPERRRAHLERMLAEEDPSAEEEPYMLELARRHLGERLGGVAPEVMEQDRLAKAGHRSFCRARLRGVEASRQEQRVDRPQGLVRLAGERLVAAGDRDPLL